MKPNAPAPSGRLEKSSSFMRHELMGAPAQLGGAQPGAERL